MHIAVPRQHLPCCPSTAWGAQGLCAHPCSSLCVPLRAGACAVTARSHKGAHQSPCRPCERQHNATPPTVGAQRSVSLHHGSAQQQALAQAPGAQQEARGFMQRCISLVLAGALMVTPLTAEAAPSMSELHVLAAGYEQAIHRKELAARKPRSSLPTADEARFMSLDRDMFTDDAWAGMVKLQQYGKYLEEVEASGLEDGCVDCAANRLMLEKAWQTVANEYFDAKGHFSQAAWADTLLTTLKDAGGALRTRSDTYMALHSMLAHLNDPYTEFLEPGQFRRALRRPRPAERNYLAAMYIGVGMQIGGLSADSGRLVEAPLADSPAENAGVLRGDRLLEIEGMPADQLSLDEVTTLLRGPAGSTVTVAIASSNSSGHVRRLELERRSLPQPPVQEARLPLPGGRTVSYLRLRYFSHDATAAMAQALQAGEADGCAGFIVDLRNDPGGVFEEAVAIATLLLPPTANVAQTIRNAAVVDAVWSRSSLSGELAPQLLTPISQRPLVVLTNRSTASASEVLAGALRDNHRATLIGEKTYGKGVVQYFFPLEDQSGLKITVAKYLTPGGYDISREGGVAPDIMCHDFPHGVFTRGTADRCVLSALQRIISEEESAPTTLRPLFASTESQNAQS